MDFVEQMKQRALALDVEGFEKRFRGYYLLGRFAVQEEEDEDDEWSFSTDIRVAGDFGPGRGIGGFGGATSYTYSLWKVEKTDRNAFRRRISVGRANNNDVVIKERGVSKLHAHFLYGTMVRLDLRYEGDLLITDVGSTNGTKVNGDAVVEGRSVPVRPGDFVVFGDVHCELHNARTLYKQLRSIVL